MSRKNTSTNFTFAAIDFLWTTIAFIYFMSKPYVEIAGVFYLVPVLWKSFKHWVQKDQEYVYYTYSIIATVTTAIILIFEICVLFGIADNPRWFPKLLLYNVAYSFCNLTENYEPYKRGDKGGK